MAQNKKYLVFDIGGTKIRSAVWNGHQLDQMSEMVTPKGTTDDLVAKIEQHTAELRQRVELAGVGVATAGPVDVVAGCIRNPANLGNGDSSWKNFPLKEKLVDAFSLPVVVDNDAAMTAFGHYKHFEKERTKDLVVVTLGTGLGVGAIVNGELARAGQSMHPELGHCIIADEADNDHPTPFANFPTMESYLSGFHFSKRVGQALGKELTGSELIQLSQEQDEKVMQMWQDYSRRMAVALCNLYLAYFPKKFVLAGGFAMVAEPFFRTATETWLQKLLHEREKAGMPIPSLEVSANHADLPLLGAAYRCQ